MLLLLQHHWIIGLSGLCRSSVVSPLSSQAPYNHTYLPFVLFIPVPLHKVQALWIIFCQHDRSVSGYIVSKLTLLLYAWSLFCSCILFPLSLLSTWRKNPCFFVDVYRENFILTFCVFILPNRCVTSFSTVCCVTSRLCSLTICSNLSVF